MEFKKSFNKRGTEIPKQQDHKLKIAISLINVEILFRLGSVSGVVWCQRSGRGHSARQSFVTRSFRNCSDKCLRHSLLAETK
jgi:hypothetical protein